jgi:hypothetical protein
MGEWIKTADRLPPEYEDVLFTNGKEITMGYLLFYEGALIWWSYGDHEIDFDDIKYWMPLPKLPEELQND